MAEVLCFITISDSPYKSHKIPFPPGITVGNIKQLVIDKFTAEQKTETSDLTIRSSPQLSFSDDDHDLYNELDPKDFRIVNITVRNEKIYERLSTARMEPIYGLTAYANFEYVECNQTLLRELQDQGRGIVFPKRSTSRVIPFNIIHFMTNKSLVVRFLTPDTLNYGFGPTIPCRYYQLYPDGRVGIYYTKGIEHEPIYQDKKCEDVEQFLCLEITENNPSDHIKWNIPIEDCRICFDMKPECYLEPCGHIALCGKCISTMPDKICPQCQKPFIDFECINHIRKIIK